MKLAAICLVRTNMRVGGGKAKGSAWERESGKALSLWLTKGAMPDIFSRNVLSGGAFTAAQGRGKESNRMAGDLMAAHPAAFRFLANYIVECKHLASLGLEAFLFDTERSSPLSRIIMYARGQARQTGLHYMLIAKQNRREAFVIVDGSIGEQLLSAIPPSPRRLPPPHHKLHGGSIFLLPLSSMCSRVDPDLFLKDF